MQVHIGRFEDDANGNATFMVVIIGRDRNFTHEAVLVEPEDTGRDWDLYDRAVHEDAPPPRAEFMPCGEGDNKARAVIEELELLSRLSAKARKLPVNGACVITTKARTPARQVVR